MIVMLIPLMLLLANVTSDEIYSSCTTLEGLLGKCVPLDQCSNLLAITLNDSLANDVSLAPYECTNPHNSSSNRWVCCREEQIFKQPEQCGLSSSVRIARGNKTVVFEFPWMVLLFYQNLMLMDDSAELECNCGGTLISDRYVLTAAHCLTENGRMALKYARLGEHTISSSIDCNNITDPDTGDVESDCADPVQNVPIETTIVHERYISPYEGDDIGLIRLGRIVEFFDHIKPICLPLTTEAKDMLLPNYLVAGWGYTEHSNQSDVLLKAQLPLMKRADCQRLIDKQTNDRSRLTISENQICAGGRDLVDSCSGDSGGPLMWPVEYANRTRMVQFGVVSYGVQHCGLYNFPGIYVRLGGYITWILEHVKA